MIVLHHNDLDGRCAAAIVSGWAGIKPVYKTNPFMAVEMDYAKSVPFDLIGNGEQVWIVDFSLSLSDMDKLRTITKDIVWIDHHKTAIAKYVDYPHKIIGIRRDEEAGCVLTWKYVHWYSARGSKAPDFNQPCGPGLEVPRAVAMIGDYDTWAHKIKDSTAFYEGMKLQDTSPETGVWFDLMTEVAVHPDGSDASVDRCGPIIKEGMVALRYRDSYCKDMCDCYGFESELDGVKCWVTNIYRFGSLGFGERRLKYPLLVACVFDGNRWTISLYTEDKTLDVSEIAKRYGGGGHRGASGFVCDVFPFKRRG